MTFMNPDAGTFGVPRSRRETRPIVTTIILVLLMAKVVLEVLKRRRAARLEEPR